VNCFERLAEIAGGQQGVLPVLAVEEQNVYVAVKLAVLEAVVEQMDEGPEFLARNAIAAASPSASNARIVATRGDIDRNAASRE